MAVTGGLVAAEVGKAAQAAGYPAGKLGLQALRGKATLAAQRLTTHLTQQAQVVALVLLVKTVQRVQRVTEAMALQARFLVHQLTMLVAVAELTKGLEAASLALRQQQQILVAVEEALLATADQAS